MNKLMNQKVKLINEYNQWINESMNHRINYWNNEIMNQWIN